MSSRGVAHHMFSWGQREAESKTFHLMYKNIFWTSDWYVKESPLVLIMDTFLQGTYIFRIMCLWACISKGLMWTPASHHLNQCWLIIGAWYWDLSGSLKLNLSSIFLSHLVWLCVLVDSGCYSQNLNVESTPVGHFCHPTLRLFHSLCAQP